MDNKFTYLGLFCNKSRNTLILLQQQKNDLPIMSSFYKNS